MLHIIRRLPPPVVRVLFALSVVGLVLGGSILVR